MMCGLNGTNASPRVAAGWHLVPAYGGTLWTLSNFLVVDRIDLVRAAESEGNRSSAYSLDGGLPAEHYVLALEEGGWSVYYSERGQRTGEVRFDTEHEACDYLLLQLVSDPTTR
jgi:hypothetical protein